jgi:hypothetical protein
MARRSRSGCGRTSQYHCVWPAFGRPGHPAGVFQHHRRAARRHQIRLGFLAGAFGRATVVGRLQPPQDRGREIHRYGAGRLIRPTPGVGPRLSRRDSRLSDGLMECRRGVRRHSRFGFWRPTPFQATTEQTADRSRRFALPGAQGECFTALRCGLPWNTGSKA